ncbi:hypothetical protein C453_10655 [Haloferax elongans ATCC BAA-1513]|uniref:Uncharacterized protein n=1 Tax=Haloferax elongans ATCC BAA-1513 TaxID=1230453 RepID=M0HKH0_HALEO|nr:hypothetical protein [Haloferax elongans]ELZ85035.1 hypothetical protein C453_10655 [Haloferax elongans ATCC BAA-1513]
MTVTRSDSTADVEADSGPAPAVSDSPSLRTAVAYALLFSVPVGVGVTVMMTRVVPGSLTTPLVVGPGLLLGIAVFALVVVAARSGENATN